MRLDLRFEQLELRHLELALRSLHTRPFALKITLGLRLALARKERRRQDCSDDKGEQQDADGTLRREHVLTRSSQVQQCKSQPVASENADDR